MGSGSDYAIEAVTGDAKILELAIGEMGKLTDGVAMAPIGADLRQDKGHKHGMFLMLNRPIRPV
jgi:hypothetical protein